MNQAISIALLAVGVILIVFGINASQSFSSDVSRFFTGSPTDKSMWLFVGGAVSMAAGLVMLFQNSRRI
jgi:hypothetical protein